MRQQEEHDANPFRGTKGLMKSRIAVILAVLCGWGVLTFGFQLLLHLTDGRGPLSSFSVFHLPFHFWFTAQLLPLWFLILCFLFNSYMDRIEERDSRRRDYDDDWH